MLSHYHTEVNADDENNSHAAMLRMIGFNKRVLEAGCASGHVSEMLHAQGCTVVGIEIDAAGLDPALPWLERVVVGNIEDGALWDELDGELFDAVLFGDVLEHLKDPLGALRSSVRHLEPSGMIVISVPNIAHADVKIALAKGTFPYGETGLLDRTHVVFFTKESLLELIRTAGLVATEISRVTVPVFGTEIGVKEGDVGEDVLAALLLERDSETYQFVVKAVPDNGAHSLTGLEDQLVELTDQLTDQTRRNETLTVEMGALGAKLRALELQHENDARIIARLSHQTAMVKCLLPSPLRRLVRRLLSPREGS